MIIMTKCCFLVIIVLLLNCPECKPSKHALTKRHRLFSSPAVDGVHMDNAPQRLPKMSRPPKPNMSPPLPDHRSAERLKDDLRKLRESYNNPESHYNTTVLLDRLHKVKRIMDNNIKNMGESVKLDRSQSRSPTKRPEAKKVSEPPIALAVEKGPPYHWSPAEPQPTPTAVPGQGSQDRPSPNQTQYMSDTNDFDWHLGRHIIHNGQTGLFIPYDRSTPQTPTDHNRNPPPDIRTLPPNVTPNVPNYPTQNPVHNPGNEPFSGAAPVSGDKLDSTALPGYKFYVLQPPWLNFQSQVQTWYGPLVPGHEATNHGQIPPGHGQNPQNDHTQNPHEQIPPGHGQNPPGHGQNPPGQGQIPPGYAHYPPDHEVIPKDSGSEFDSKTHLWIGVALGSFGMCILCFLILTIGTCMSDKCRLTKDENNQATHSINETKQIQLTENGDHYVVSLHEPQNGAALSISDDEGGEEEEVFNVAGIETASQRNLRQQLESAYSSSGLYASAEDN